MCGVFGIWGHKNAAEITARGLHHLQHRGQEGVGIISYKSKQPQRHPKARHYLGKVGDNFSPGEHPKRLASLKGDVALGHVRYSTAGSMDISNVQPFVAKTQTSFFAVAHNGNFTNGMQHRLQLEEEGAIFHTTSDSEVLQHLFARSSGGIANRMKEALNQLRGGFALANLCPQGLIGARDRLGIRPLVLGMLDGAYILTSETCALDAVGARFVREIENGEMVIINEQGLESHRLFEKEPVRPCIFEYVYFSRPNSFNNGIEIAQSRHAMGRELARETPLDVDIIIPVPDSGIHGAEGYQHQTGIPLGHGFVRHHNADRTFIDPKVSARRIQDKLAVTTSYFKDKRVALVDDSIVRGNTSREIVRMAFDAGAREVHFLSLCPPIKHGDFYGIDTADESKLLARSHNTEQMRRFMGSTSLNFLSLDGLYRALGYQQGRNNEAPPLTDHPFTGDYPEPLIDKDAGLLGSNGFSR